MYRSNPQFVSVQRVSDRVNNNYVNLDNPKILYRYEETNNRQFAVAQDRREQFVSNVDERYEANDTSLSPFYRNLSATRCNTAECDSCSCGNSNTYQLNNCPSGYCGDSYLSNDCQSGCCGDSCQRPYRQAQPRPVYNRFI